MTFHATASQAVRTAIERMLEQAKLLYSAESTTQSQAILKARLRPTATMSRLCRFVMSRRVSPEGI